jgi:hypothetical protein
VKSETLANFFCFAYTAGPLYWRSAGAKPGFGGRTALRGPVRTAGRQLRELAEAQSLLARSGHRSRDSRRSASTQVPSWSLLGVRKFDCRISEDRSTRRGRLDHFEHQVVRISEHNQFESANVDRLGTHCHDLAARGLPGFCHRVHVLHTKLKNRCARILEALEPNHVPVELDRPVEAGDV